MMQCDAVQLACFDTRIEAFALVRQAGTSTLAHPVLNRIALQCQCRCEFQQGAVEPAAGAIAASRMIEYGVPRAERPAPNTRCPTAPSPPVTPTPAARPAPAAPAVLRPRAGAPAGGAPGRPSLSARCRVRPSYCPSCFPRARCTAKPWLTSRRVRSRSTAGRCCRSCTGERPS